MNSDLRLSDMGERQIVLNLIANRFPEVKNNFDDAALVPIKEGFDNLVISTDPCPTPVVCILKGRDLYKYGIMTVLINVSDLASMGATPAGILVSTVMPEDMLANDYVRFLDGVEDACRKYNCPLIGGNIKDGREFTANGTAFGFANNESAMKRSGAKPGDSVCIIGDMGLFWASIAMLKNGFKLDEEIVEVLKKALDSPEAKLQEGIELANCGQVNSCMDSSDGIVACMREIAKASNVDIIIDDKLITPHPAVRKLSELTGIDHRNFMFSWGDWNLVCTIPRGSISDVQNALEKIGTKINVIGNVVAGNGKVSYLYGGQQHTMNNNFSSERFCGTSMFTHNIEPYYDLLLSSFVFTEDDA